MQSLQLAQSTSARLATEQRQISTFASQSPEVTMITTRTHTHNTYIYVFIYSNKDQVQFDAMHTIKQMLCIAFLLKRQF